MLGNFDTGIAEIVIHGSVRLDKIKRPVLRRVLRSFPIEPVPFLYEISGDFFLRLVTGAEINGFIDKFLAPSIPP